MTDYADLEKRLRAPVAVHPETGELVGHPLRIEAADAIAEAREALKPALAIVGMVSAKGHVSGAFINGAPAELLPFDAIAQMAAVHERLSRARGKDAK